MAIVIEMRNKKTWICFWLLFQISFVWGQDITPRDTTAIDLNKLLELSLEDLANVSVITPTQNLQKSGSAPATVLVITGDQIRLRGYRNLAEVLNDLADISVHDKSDLQFYNPITIRGIYGQQRFVILMDGVKISSPTNEPLPILENFPIYLARQIEVVYGPGSALYGADAMSGVINIITEKRNDDGLLVNAIGGTQGYSNGNLIFNKTLEGDLNATVAGQYSYDDQPDFSKIYKNEYDMSFQESGQFNTSYGPMTPVRPVKAAYEAPIKAYNVYASLSNDRFNVRVLSHYTQVPSSTTLRTKNAVYNKDVFYGQGVTVASAGYTTSIGQIKSTTSLMGSFYKVNPKSNYRNLYGSMETGYKYSTGSMIRAEEQLAFPIARQLNFTGGLVYELFQSLPKSPELAEPVSGKGAVRGRLLNSVAYYNPEGIHADFFPLVYNNVGTYVQLQYSPIEEISLTGGLRYDHNSRFGSTVNPRIGGVFKPGEKTTFKALYGRAYWAPSPMASFEWYGSFYTLDSGRTYQSSFLHLPNPSLKPVTSQTAEWSVQQKIGKKLSATLTGYYTEIKNIIKPVSDNGSTDLYDNKFLNWDVAYVEVPVNLGTQTTYGGNVMLNSTFEIGQVDFNAYSSLSYVEGHTLEFVSATETKQVELPLIAPWLFRAGLDGRWSGVHFSMRLLKTSKQRVGGFLDAENPDRRQTIAGYTLLNASMGYTFRNKATVYLNVQNALDQRYRNPLSVDLNNANSEVYHGSLQDPIRVLLGLRLSVF